MNLNTWEYILRLTLSALFGGGIGLERELRLKGAGIRTHLIVSFASCMMTLVSKYGFIDVLDNAAIKLDPSRIAAGLVTAIGFLGAGAISAHRRSLTGMTTAAGLWATVGIGMCASMGQFLLSSGTKGKRFLTSHARVLMHQPSGGIGGTTTDVRISAELIMNMKKTLAELTAEQTGHTVEEIYRDNEYDHWFTAQEALEYGFVDKLVSTHDTMNTTKE